MRISTEGTESAYKTELRTTPVIRELLLRIQGEYREMPGLSLTVSQAARLLGLDSSMCALALTTLIERRFLRRTVVGMYVLRQAG